MSSLPRRMQRNAREERHAGPGCKLGVTGPPRKRLKHKLKPKALSRSKNSQRWLEKRAKDRAK